MDVYKDSPARKRALDIEIVKTAETVDVPDYPLPIDDSGDCSDTIDEFPPHTRTWTKQNDRIFIDEDLDIICDEADIIISHLKKRGIKILIYLGVHVNMCILSEVFRSFAIKPMRRRGVKTALVRDLTDAMYNPEKAPYVSHDEGTRLVIEYIEKFYSPTIDSSQI